MKKTFSAVLAAAMSITALTSAPSLYTSEKAEAAGSKSGIVIFGDSIGAGGLRSGSVAHNYGEICGDYLGCKVSNYAVSGYDAADLVQSVENLTDTQKKAVADSEVVVISIGGNDIMHSLSRSLLDYAARKESQKFLNEGYTKADIPEKPSLTDLMNMLNIKDEGGLMDYMNNGGYNEKLEVTNEIGAAFSSIYNEGGTFDEQTIPNLKKAVADIKAIAPDTRILVTNIYQPLQLQPSYVEKTYGKQSNYATFISILRGRCETTMNEFDTRLSAVDGIEVVDVKSQFTSQEKEPSTSAPGNASYFVDIQTGSLKTGDVHPNQKGHIAYAAAILEKIGRLHTDNGLLSQTFNGLSDKDSYPAIALETYKKVAGEAKPAVVLGDVNDDGKVNAVDASKVLAEYAKTSSGSGKGDFTDAQRTAADVDGNGKVDSVDASKILAYYAYTSTEKGTPKSITEFLKTL